MSGEALKSVLYMSRSQIVFAERGSHVREIVEFSKGWNSAVGISGALVSTERRFVQFIEGPTAAIDDLVAKLRADRRHTDVRIIEETRAKERQFSQWSLAYSGPDTFIDEDLVHLLQPQPSPSNDVVAGRLRSLLFAMAASAGR